MPRNGSGVMSWPAGTAAVTAAVISSTAYNAFLADLLSDLNAARPITTGGTGSTTASAARTALGLAIGSDVQAYDAALDDISALARTDGNIIVGDGGNWVAESGATARASLGVSYASAAEVAARTEAGKVISPATAAYMPGFIYGLTVSNNGTDATNDIDIAAGRCRSLADDANMVLAIALTKRLDETWAAGTNDGMRDSSLNSGAIADRTYHIWLVSDGSTVDVYATDQVTSAGCITALQAETGGSGYLYARRVRSIQRASGAIKAERQFGDTILYAAPVNDRTSTSAQSLTLLSLTVPNGIQVMPYISAYSDGDQQESYTTSVGDGDGSTSGHVLMLQASGAIGGTRSDTVSPAAFVTTNTSGEIRYTFATSGGSPNIYNFRTHGYIDHRERT